MAPKPKRVSRIGRWLGLDQILAQLDRIEAKIDEWHQASTSLEEALSALKAADATIDAIEPQTTGESQ